MRSESPLHINLHTAAHAAAPYHAHLTDSFFAELEQEEISGGDVNVEVNVKETAGGNYTLYIKVHGSVVVACDRCLSPLSLPVDAEEEVQAKDGEASEAQDASDTLFTDKSGELPQLPWTVYEIIETSLPLQRMHPIGECDPAITALISQEETEEG